MVITAGAITAASLIAAAVAAGGSAVYGGFAGHQANEYSEDLVPYNSYLDALNKAGLTDVDTETLIYDMYDKGLITESDYKDSLSTLKSFETVYGENKTENASAGEIMAYWMESDTNRTKMHNLYNTLAKAIPEYTQTLISAESMKDYLSGFSGANAPGNAIAYAPAPTYDDVNFKGYQLDVDPVKLWTGPELAEHHNIDYDPNLFYDLIKKGTTAEVDRAMFESALMNEASMVNDTANVTSYLDNIRNTRAEAISTGATAGAQAAAEVLHNKEAINNYATNQNSVANARFNAVDNALLADAQAKVQANDYFSNLATTLGQDILALYANDTSRYGQQLLSNSDLYKADQELRGQRAYSNASMYANAIQANAAIAGYKQQANSLGDEYAWVFNNFLRANNGDYYKAYVDMDGYLNSRYFGNGITSVQEAQKVYNNQ